MQLPEDDATDLEKTAADDVSEDDAAIWAELDKADADEAAHGKQADSGDDGADDFADSDGDNASDNADADNTGDDGDANGGDDGAATAAAASSLWDSAPPELRNEYEALKAENAKIEQKARSATGRATGFQRRYEDLLKAAEPRKTEGDDRADLDAAMAALKDDYPEIAQPLQKALGVIEGNVNQLSAAEERRREAALVELNDFVEAETSAVLEQHPDYQQVLADNGPKFLAWVDDQPKKVREAFARNAEQIVNAAETAEIVSSFKAYLGQPAAVPASQRPTTPSLSARRERQLGSTASPSSRHRRPTVSGIPEEGDPQVIWDAFDAADRR